MNPMDRHLDRLLKAAAATSPRPMPELSFPTEARVLAQWRATRGESDWTAVMAFFRRGLVLTSALAAVAVTLSLLELQQQEPSGFTESAAAMTFAYTR